MAASARLLLLTKTIVAMRPITIQPIAALSTGPIRAHKETLSCTSLLHLLLSPPHTNTNTPQLTPPSSTNTINATPSKNSARATANGNPNSPPTAKRPSAPTAPLCIKERVTTIPTTTTVVHPGIKYTQR